MISDIKNILSLESYQKYPDVRSNSKKNIYRKRQKFYVETIFFFFDLKTSC